MPKKSIKVKSNYLTLEQKIKIISLKKNNEITAAKLATQFNVTISTIFRILHDEDKITAKAQHITNPSKFCYLHHKSVILVEDILYKWFVHFRELHLVITDEILQIKAEQIFIKIKSSDMSNGLPEKFEFSNGWLDKFKTRFNICAKRICGDGVSISMLMVNNERLILQNLLRQYDKEDILNADELGLFYCLCPNYTLTEGNKNATSTPQLKSRITALLCCNTTGTFKFKPLIIGNRKKPQSFPTQNEMDKMNLLYDYSDNSWMTTEIWIQWIEQLDACLSRKTLLLIDNCKPHTTLRHELLGLKHLVVYFLPPNMTAYLQPCDAGIIHSFKANYRKLLVKYIINSYEMNKLDIRIEFNTVLKFVSKAWNDVNSSIINNCWHHTGILINSEKINTNDPNVDELRKNLNSLNKLNPTCTMSVDEFINIDKNIDDLQQQESYIDVLINNIKQHNTLESKKSDYLNKIISTNKDTFHKTITSMQNEDNALLIDILYDLVMKTRN